MIFRILLTALVVEAAVIVVCWVGDDGPEKWPKAVGGLTMLAFGVNLVAALITSIWRFVP